MNKMKIEERVVRATGRLLRTYPICFFLMVVASALLTIGGCALFCACVPVQVTYKTTPRLLRALNAAYGTARQGVLDHITFRDAFKNEDGSYSIGRPVISDEQLKAEIAQLEAFKERINQFRAKQTALSDIDISAVIYDGKLGGGVLTYGDLVKANCTCGGLRRELIFVLSLGAFCGLFMLGLATLWFVDHRKRLVRE